MKYIFITFTGASFSIAKRLIDEGNEVMVGQVRDPDELRIKGWQADKESPEKRNRRLSLYDGMLDKIDANYALQKMQHIADIGKAEEYFVVLEHNNLCRYGEKILKMGFTGLLPNYEDYDREKDRVAAHVFVETYYPNLHLLPSQSLTKAADGISLVQQSDDLWVLKSNGNFGNTVVPRTENVALNHMQIVGALEACREQYERGGYLLEVKIAQPIEFAPVLAFWNGEPVYAHVEFECKPMCAGDVGPDAGGATNLVLRLDTDDEALSMFFPPIVYEMARARRGLFLFDAGVLYDPATRKCYFTEFAGNRWGWGGVFSEMTMAAERGKVPTAYFEDISAGVSPFRYRFGATVSLYNTAPDSRFPRMMAGDRPIYCDEEVDHSLLYFQQIKKGKDGIYRNVGGRDDEDTLAFSTGYGNTGLNIITGPGQFNTDFSIGKRTTVGGIRENAELAFRVEFYNTFNHPQFSNPGTTYGTANFGVVTQSSVAPRLIQFGLKYLF